MQKQVRHGLSAGLLVCCFTASAMTASMGAVQINGTWMTGPGCGGKSEWFRHPASFPYFCDGAAVVVKARWRHWGQSVARAHATFNEAVLTSHNSVGTAPRRASAVTITASHIKICANRRVYSSIVIRYDKPQKGPRTLRLASSLPGCA
jgi:hypothetical protein